MRIPDYLKKGDTVAITCTAGFMPKKNSTACVQELKKQGYNVIVSPTVGGKSKTYFAGTDEERLIEFQKYMDDKNVKAIVCGRGGYGTGRIIDKVDFTKFIKNPKWIVGFSDITIMLNHISTNFEIASIHGPMSTAFRFEEHNPENVKSLLAALKGEKNNYECASHVLNKTGTATGKLFGGNITLLCNAIGTSSDFKTKNTILFLEDVGESFYEIDRMMHQLKRAGKLKNLKALIIGTFTDMTDTERPFGKPIYDNIKEMVAEYNYPVCFNFPVGHGTENRALKIGETYQLKITSKNTILEEI